MTVDLQDQVNKAQSGDHIALESVVRNIQDNVHHLAMRMLVNPDDALDATQEILILVITKLSTFQGKSEFQTWVYRIAVNYILNMKKTTDRKMRLNFELFRTDLEENLTENSEPIAEHNLLLNELRIACTMAMLLCLDIKHRVAYVLGDILELGQSEAVEILEISKNNYRKRLSRARADVLAFTSISCGIVNDNAKCSCPRRLPSAMELGRVRPNDITYAIKQAPSYKEYADVLEETKKLEGSLRNLCLQRATPKFNSPKDFGNYVSEIVEGIN